MKKRVTFFRIVGVCLLVGSAAQAQVQLQPVPAGQWTGTIAVSFKPEPMPESVCVTPAQSGNPLLLIPTPAAGCTVNPSIVSPTSISWTTTCAQPLSGSGTLSWSSTQLQRIIQQTNNGSAVVTAESLRFTGTDCRIPSDTVVHELAVNAPAVAAPAADPTAPPVLIGAGDIALCEKIVAHTYPAWHTGLLIKTLLPKMPTATVFTAGDNAYMWGTEVDFNGCYDPAWGSFREITFPTAGNHDIYTRNGGPYYDYFGANAGPRGLGYYSYDRGNWHLVALNSNTITAAELVWLKSDLDANTKPCLAAYWHHPLYSSGNHGNDPNDEGRRTKAFWLELLRHHADVVIGGHDHIYERFARQDADEHRDPNGIREFVVGTGGGELDNIAKRRPNSELVLNSNYGVIMLMLNPDSFEWQFLCAMCPAGQGPVLDKSSAPEKCHGAP